MLGTCGEQWKPVNTVTNKPLKFGVLVFIDISNNSALNNEVIIRRAGGRRWGSIVSEIPPLLFGSLHHGESRGMTI